MVRLAAESPREEKVAVGLERQAKFQWLKFYSIKRHLSIH
jgi:hypothetical protein